MAQLVLEPPYGLIQAGQLLAQPRDVGGGRQVDPVQGPPGGLLDAPAGAGSQPQHKPCRVGELLGLHGPLQLLPDRPLDRVKRPAPQGPLCHDVCAPHEDRAASFR